MESVSWNPMKTIRRYQERRREQREETAQRTGESNPMRRQRQREEASRRTGVSNPMRRQRRREEASRRTGESNPMRMIRPQREEARTEWNPIRWIRNRQQRRQQRREQLQDQLRRQQEEESRTVEISHPRTRIRGITKKSTWFPSLEYVAFLGIRYALPPVGERRFQPPEPLPELSPDEPTELFVADNPLHPCTQKYRGVYMGSEDCLYLNIFTPRRPVDIPQLLPVLVYIHGGGFLVGQNNDTDPESLIREDLIVVTINYRLGIFGFLNMRTKNCLGNAGMKDQVMALQWVQKNIEPFKGNPNNVTICGQSAGGTCVNLHMLSPLSKGLFQKAIVMGGGVYCPWGFGGHEKHVKQLFKDAMENSSGSRHAVVESLKTFKTYRLWKLGQDTMSAYSVTQPNPRKMTTYYKPSVECVKKDAFLPYTVEKLMKEAEPVPTIAGITKQEGYMYFTSNVPDVTELMTGEITFVELVKDIIRQNFNWRDPTADERHFRFFKDMYFPEDWMLEEGEDEEEEIYMIMTSGEQMRRERRKHWKLEEQKHHLATLVTDIYFRRFYDNFRMGNLLNEGEPPFYVYEFDYFAGQPLFPIEPVIYNLPLIIPRAAEHSDDYHFLFNSKRVREMLTRIASTDRNRVRLEIDRVQSNMSSLWSSFCKDENPTSRWEGDADVEWERHTEQAPHYLHIGKELKLINRRLNEGRWSELNAVCQLEPTFPSLAVTPRTSPPTPKKEFSVFQLSQLKLDTSSTQAPGTQCTSKVFQLSQPKPDDQSTS